MRKVKFKKKKKENITGFSTVCLVQKYAHSLIPVLFLLLLFHLQVQHNDSLRLFFWSPNSKHLLPHQFLTGSRLVSGSY